MKAGEAIIFDLDETLVDRRGSLDIYAELLWREFRDATSLDAETFICKFHELDGNGRVPRRELFRRLDDQVFTGVGTDVISDHFANNAWLEPLLFADVIKSLRQFSALGFRLGIVTNGSSASQRAKLEHSGLHNEVETWVISEELGVKKPDPLIYLEVAHRLKIDPARSWFVGDDPVSDVWGPRQVGFRSVWLERYLGWPEELEVCYESKISHISDLRARLMSDLHHD